MSLREELHKLEIRVSNRYSELISKADNIKICTNEGVENGEGAYVEIRDSISGSPYDAQVVSVSESGIRVYIEENNEYKEVGLYDLSEIRDRITLIEEIETALSKV